MWLLHFLPDTFLQLIVNTILIIGIVSTFLSFVVLNNLLRYFPPLANYYRIAQAVSIIILVMGVYFKGGYSTEMLWREKVAEMQAKLDLSAAQSEQASKQIETQVITQTKIVKEKGQDIIKYIDRWNTKEVIVEGPERIKREEIIKYIEMCPVPAAVIDAHNAAATLNKAAEGVKK